MRENGSGGTDHGHGSCLFVLGNQVDGGKVHGSFAGLDQDLLYEGRDLPVTTDFRSVFTELAGRHLGMTDPTDLPRVAGTGDARCCAGVQLKPAAARLSSLPGRTLRPAAEGCGEMMAGGAGRY